MILIPDTWAPHRGILSLVLNPLWTTVRKFPKWPCKYTGRSFFVNKIITIFNIIVTVIIDQVYSSTRVSTRLNTSQHESTQVNTNQHESDTNHTSLTRVNTNQHESTQINTSPTRVNTNQHESKTSLDHKK